MWVSSRTLDANDGTGPHTWTYNYSSSGTTTVTDPLGQQTVHTFAVDTSSPAPAFTGYEGETQQYAGTAGSSQLLKTVARTYAWNEPVNPDSPSSSIGAFPISITTTLDNQKTSFVSTQLCCSVSYQGVDGMTFTNQTGTYGLPSDVKTYDYGPGSHGPLLKDVATKYQWQINNAYFTANLLRLVQSQSISNGSALLSQTTNTYDEPNYFTFYPTSTQIGTPQIAVRGNLTTSSRTLVGGTNAASHTNWYSYGEPYLQIDPMGHTTTYAYSPTYAEALPTTVTDPLGHATTYTYDPSLGIKTSSTDPNGQTTGYTPDNLGRLHIVRFPDAYAGTHGQTTYTYNDAVPPAVYVSKLLIPSSTTPEQFELDLDGLGRLEHTKDLNNPRGIVITDITYDGLGRKYTVTNPHLSGPSLTDGTTTYTYDALNRKTLVTNQDGSVVRYSYTGQAEEVQDEGNGSTLVTKIMQTDALGHTLSTCEVTGQSQQGGGSPTACGQDIGATGFLTTYVPDALGNLLYVYQGNLPARSFVYDTLSRLTYATNPENGTTHYVYDQDGKVIQRTRPAPNQSNAAITATTTYSYDQGERLYAETYSDGNSANTPTPSAHFDYDAVTNALIKDTGPNQGQNLIGRKVDSYVTNANGTTLAGEAYSYDPVGRTLDNPQCTQFNCATGNYDLTYSYDVDGNLLSLSVPETGFTLTYGYNASAQLTSVTSANTVSDAAQTGLLLGAVTYTPLGGISGAAYKNGAAEALSYNNRGWVVGDGVSGFAANGTPTTLYSFNVTQYAPDGNMLAVADSVNGSWAYTYDGFNRIATATLDPGTGNAAALGWSYDRYGNRWKQSVISGTQTAPQPQLSFTGSNNRVDQYGYDAAGNLTYDGIHHYSYDDESRIVAVDNGGTGQYVYDADGLRIHKVGGADGPEDYLYDLSGHAIATFTMPSGTALRGEIYAGNGNLHVATLYGGTTYFSHTDWTGTERARSGANGVSVETCFSLPYGDDQQCQGTDSSPLHFTGKMRDTETGLDSFQARYYASMSGRWMLPDWSALPEAVPYATLGNPQTLNLYTYVGNNPITHTDVDGHYFGEPGDPGQPGCTDGCSTSLDPENGTPVPGGDAYATMAGQAQLAYLTGGNPAAAASAWAQQHNTSQGNNAIYKAFTLGAQYGERSIGATDKVAVNVRHVGFTDNVQIPGDTLDESKASSGWKDPLTSFHDGAESYYFGGPLHLFGFDAGHVAAGAGKNADPGIEAHHDTFGPLNPIHWIFEALPSLFINTRNSAVPVRYTCSVSGGCSAQ